MQDAQVAFIKFKLFFEIMLMRAPLGNNSPQAISLQYQNSCNDSFYGAQLPLYRLCLRLYSQVCLSFLFFSFLFFSFLFFSFLFFSFLFFSFLFFSFLFFSFLNHIYREKRNYLRNPKILIPVLVCLFAEAVARAIKVVKFKRVQRERANFLFFNFLTFPFRTI